MAKEFNLNDVPFIENERENRPTDFPWMHVDEVPTTAEEPEFVGVAIGNVVEDYTQRAISIAQDNRHGYSQQNRWGPDYDCSSMVITVLQNAGIPVKDLGATFTGNMREALLSSGFKNVTTSCNLANGAGMQRGDILLNDVNHTAIYIGNGQLVHARSSEGNSIPGDQSGNEIRVQPYYNYPWNGVFRYARDDESAPIENLDKTDDELASNGETRYYELRFPYLRRGCEGRSVAAMQLQLSAQGYNIGPDGADGDLGGNTERALKEFQADAGLKVDGVVGPDTGAVLFGAEVGNAASVEKQEAAGEAPDEAHESPDACPIDGVSLEKLSAFLLSPEFKAAFKAWEG